MGQVAILGFETRWKLTRPNVVSSETTIPLTLVLSLSLSLSLKFVKNQQDLVEIWTSSFEIRQQAHCCCFVISLETELCPLESKPTRPMHMLRSSRTMVIFLGFDMMALMGFKFVVFYWGKLVCELFKFYVCDFSAFDQVSNLLFNNKKLLSFIMPTKKYIKSHKIKKRKKKVSIQYSIQTNDTLWKNKKKKKKIPTIL